MTMIHARCPNGAAILPGMALILLTLAAQSAAGPVLRVETDPQSPAIAFLSWDTEGGEQARMNLLRSGSVIRVCIAGEWLEAEKLPSVSLQVRWPDGEVSNQEITDLSGRVIMAGEDELLAHLNTLNNLGATHLKQAIVPFYSRTAEEEYFCNSL
jgi:hypothetical protein